MLWRGRDREESRVLKHIRRRISHIRHLRGHNIHSPYIYKIAREVFLAHKLIPADDISIYERVCEVDERLAIELQNIYTTCEYSDPEQMKILTTELCEEQILQSITEAKENGTTIVVLLPCRDHAREALCERIVAQHHSTTLWRAGYLLIFNNHLPKQHFQL